MSTPQLPPSMPSAMRRLLAATVAIVGAHAACVAATRTDTAHVAPAADTLTRRSFAWRVDSVLQRRDINDDKGIDTAYVGIPEQRVRLQVDLNFTGQGIRAESPLDEQTQQHMDLDSRMRTSLGMAVAYRNVEASFTVLPSSVFGYHGRDYDMSFSTFGARWGGRASIRYSESFRGSTYLERTPADDASDGTSTDASQGWDDWSQWTGLGSTWRRWRDSQDDNSTIENRVDFPRGILDQRLAELDGYYVFNWRRFSMPAAMAGTRLQRRSAGSVMLGASLHDDKVHIDATSPDTLLGHAGSPNSRVHLTTAALGVGYGHNFVVRGGVLIHVSVLPEWVVYSRGRLRFGDETSHMRYKFPKFLSVGRFAVVRNRGRFFYTLNTSVIVTTSGDETRLQTTTFTWHGRLSVGVRLW